MRNEAHILLCGLVLSTLPSSTQAFSPLATGSSWESYKTFHLDPLVDEFETEAALWPDATQSKASTAMAYWTQDSTDAKQRLANMRKMDDAAEFDRHHSDHTENWIHYRRALEALVPHHNKQQDQFHWPRHTKATSWADYGEMVGGLAGPAVDVDKEKAKEEMMSPDEKRSKADAFWQAKYDDDKEREHQHALEDTAHESTEYRFNEHSHFDTWGHYKHDYIDALPPQQSIEQELEELREQAAQFKALALTEIVGHALAEEALHEAEQRAESCEIAEAVLLGASADRD